MKEQNDTGVYEVNISEEQRKKYFPSKGSPRREVSPEEMAQAEKWWSEARERGEAAWPGILTEVQAVLGTRLLAVLTETKSARTVNRWIKGAQKPLDFKVKRIVQAQRVISMMSEKESPETIRAWFIGENPDLAGTAPILMMKADHQAVVTAARNLIAHGWS